MNDTLRDQLQADLGQSFRITGELAGGGMSRVFVADDLALGRRVVVKVLAPELAAGVNVERSVPDLTAIAVLPLVNTNGNPQDEYFSDGMTDELAASARPPVRLSAPTIPHASRLLRRRPSGPRARHRCGAGRDRDCSG